MLLADTNLIDIVKIQAEERYMILSDIGKASEIAGDLPSAQHSALQKSTGKPPH